MSRSRRGGLRGLIVSGVCVLAFAACGSSATSSTKGSSQPGDSELSTAKAKGNGSPQKRIDVCAVITPEDAATVFAETATSQPSASAEPLVSGLCIYSHPGDDPQVRNLLQIRVYPGEQFYGERLFPSATALSGSGDKGFIDVDPKQHTIDLQFVKNGKTGVIAYTTGAGVDIATRADAVKAVGKKLAAAM